MGGRSSRVGKRHQHVLARMVRSPLEGAEPMIRENLPYDLPPVGDNPSSTAQGTTPGSFAHRGRVGTPWTFSSPDTPGMPQPSDKTAWDFLPADWEVEVIP